MFLRAPFRQAKAERLLSPRSRRSSGLRAPLCSERRLCPQVSQKPLSHRCARYQCPLFWLHRGAASECCYCCICTLRLAVTSALGSEPSVSTNLVSDSFRNRNVGAFDQDGENARSFGFSQCLLSGAVRCSTRCIAASPLRAHFAERAVAAFRNRSKFARVRSALCGH